MDHTQMNHQVPGGPPVHHWGGYGPDNTIPQSATRQWHNQNLRGVKRAISESDDCDDIYSEESSKDPCTSPGDGNTSCYQMLSRKKRRGVIEKKRRDRINTSLTELKRLVPSAYEKQGSAKLEKAEILQMTVDHLKMLHAKGLDNLAYDPHKFAMDYHIIGFRECASEVARYLVTIEGMDVQNPLRLRLMSHLQCFVTQRELASKQSTSSPSSAWSAYPTSHAAAPPPPAVASSTPTNPQHYHGTTAVNLLHQPIHPHSSQIHHDPNLPHYTDLSSATRQSSSITPYSTSALTPLTSTATSSSPLGYHHVNTTPPQYHNLNSYPTSTSTGLSYNQNNNSAKPYRPWGAEVAY